MALEAATWPDGTVVDGELLAWRHGEAEPAPFALLKKRIGRTKLSKAILAEAGMEPSVGSVGDSHDDALAETINGLYKTELIHRRAPWKTRESVELATLEWIHWFNHIRLLEPIGYVPPAEAEANYWRQLAQQAETASST